MKNINRCAFVAGTTILGTVALAASQSFDFKDPKGVNTISFLLDSTLEPIMGVGGGISGTLDFDPANPKEMKGKIELDATTLHTAQDSMKKAMQSSDWLDVAKYPKITFQIKEIKEAKTVEPNVYDLQIKADLTVKGVTKEVTVPVRASYLAGRMGDRMRGADGDLLVLRSTFSIKRDDYEIKPGMTGDVVAQEIKLTVSIVGGAKKG